MNTITDTLKTQSPEHTEYSELVELLFQAFNTLQTLSGENFRDLGREMFLARLESAIERAEDTGRGRI